MPPPNRSPLSEYKQPFPKAKDVDELSGESRSRPRLHRQITAERWDWRVYGDPGLENETNVKSGGFIDGVDEFDPAFFDIPPREAELMDPQQQAAADARRKPSRTPATRRPSLTGRNTGVFLAAGMSDYARVDVSAQVALDGYTAMGADGGVGRPEPRRLSARPSMVQSEPIETTCSSSPWRCTARSQCGAGDATWPSSAASTRIHLLPISPHQLHEGGDADPGRRRLTFRKERQRPQ